MKNQEFSKWLVPENTLHNDSPSSYFAYINTVEENIGNLDSKSIDSLEETLAQINSSNFIQAPATLDNFRAAVRKYWKFRIEELEKGNLLT